MATENTPSLWQKLAQQHLALRPNIGVHRETFNDSDWYVLADTFTHKYYRITPEAYAFIMHLHLDATVQQVWDQHYGEGEPTDSQPREEIAKIVLQLHSAGLLRYHGVGNPELMYQNRRKQQNREKKMRWMRLIAIRFTLLDPNRLLQHTLPLGRFMASRTGWVLWLLLLLSGGKQILDHMPALMARTEGLLAPDNLPLLYAAFFVVKLFHETAHGLIAKQYGAEIRKAGIILIALVPLPYVDATCSWSLRSRWQRIFVASAGVMTELFLAAVSAHIWAATAAGTLQHNLAFNVMITASVSALLFNANPLMKLDGYYVLSDLLSTPNLTTRAAKQLAWYGKRWLLGVQTHTNPAATAKEAWLLSTYGVTSLIYRVLLLTGLFLFVVDQYLILGLLMALTGVIGFLLLPLWKLLHYLFWGNEVAQQRSRVYLRTALTLTLGITLFGILPVTESKQLQGVIESAETTPVHAGVSGYIAQIVATAGSQVTSGQTLIRLHNPQVEQQLYADKVELVKLQLMKVRATRENLADIQTIDQQIEVSVQRIREIISRQRQLQVLATQAGIWSPAEQPLYPGQWITIGQQLGTIIAPQPWQFTAVIPQSDVGELFTSMPQTAEVRFPGQAQHRATLQQIQLIPHDQWVLPSKTLSWVSGGAIEIRSIDEKGALATEPFFLIRGTLMLDQAIRPVHLRRGVLRLQRPPRSLLAQWTERGRQLLQQRYRM